MLLLIAGLVITDTAAYLSVREFLTRRVDRTLQSLAASRTEQLRSRPSLDVDLRSIGFLAPANLYLALLAPDGHVIYAHAPSASDGRAPAPVLADLAAAPDATPVTVPDDLAGAGFRASVLRVPDSTRLQVVTAGGSQRVATVVFAIPRGDDADTLHLLLVVSVAVSLGLLGAGLLVAWLALGAGLRPLRQVARTARAIERGDLHERIPVPDRRTEIGEVSVALNDAFDARARSEERVRRFVADASHELRTPLASLRGWADLYRQGGLDSWDDVDLAMGRIEDQARRMHRLVEELLLLARLDVGQRAATTSVDVAGAVRGLVEDARVRAPDRPITFVLGPGGHEATADEDALRRVVGNLLTNALTHTPAGSPVHVLVEDSPGQVRVEVVDAGPGLDEAQREKAFDRFWRADDGRGGEGTGLGLGIARDLARAQGGDLVLAAAGPDGGLRATACFSKSSGAEQMDGNLVGLAGRMSAAGRAPAPPRRSSAEDSTPPSAELPLLARAGRGCARHPWIVIGLWALLLVGTVAGNRAFGGKLSDTVSLPRSQATTGAGLLSAQLPTASGASAQIVLHVTDGEVADDSAAVEQAVTELRMLPHVLSVSDPLSEAAPRLSPDGRTAYSVVQLDQDARSLPDGYLDSVRSAVQPLTAKGVQVEYGGVLGELARPHTKDTAELIGFAVAAVVLLVAFGSVLAAFLPLVTATVGVLIGVSIVGLTASVISFGTAAPTLATMIGLGVGIDYALFLTTRFRQLVMDGEDPVAAAARTTASSGHAVLVAAGTVAVALLGLYSSGITFIGQLGLASVATVAVSALGAITLVPAGLGLLGRRIDRVVVRRPVAESGSDSDGWHRYSALVSRRPWWFLAGGVALLAVLAIPTLSLQLGHIDAGASPTSWTERRAYDLLADGFGPGVNGTFTVVVDVEGVDASAASALGSKVRTALAATSDVASVTPLSPSPSGRILVGTVVPKTGPQEQATTDLFDTLVDDTLPTALQGSSAHGYVTGSTAQRIEFGNKVSSRLLVVIGVVVLTALVLLLLTFRAPVLALQAAVLNLLSVGAAYGVVVAVFQWGWGGGLFGVPEKVPVESYVPMMMFAIVFGLSMDYEVFMLSRVQEAWRSGGDNAKAVAAGLASTGRVITSAALIMVSVFTAFVANDDVTVKMLAIGLAASVLVDASVVRMLLVPAAMTAVGDRNWWLPSWLDRVLPHLSAEGADVALPDDARQERQVSEGEHELVEDTV
jgi:RND superfamily putative drug exporter